MISIDLFQFCSVCTSLSSHFRCRHDGFYSSHAARVIDCNKWLGLKPAYHNKIQCLGNLHCLHDILNAKDLVNSFGIIVAAVIFSVPSTRYYCNEQRSINMVTSFHV